MRRFSQRNQLVTLSEINITPLLDLAFVLLIIFIITTPLLEQSIKLDLPEGGKEKTTANKADVRTIEVSPDGHYVVQGKRLSLDDLEALLMAEVEANPQTTIWLRADKAERYELVLAVLEICERHGIRRVKFATRPVRN